MRFGGACYDDPDLTVGLVTTIGLGLDSRESALSLSFDKVSTNFIFAIDIKLFCKLGPVCSYLFSLGDDSDPKIFCMSSITALLV